MKSLLQESPWSHGLALWIQLPSVYRAWEANDPLSKALSEGCVTTPMSFTSLKPITQTFYHLMSSQEERRLSAERDLGNKPQHNKTKTQKKILLLLCDVRIAEQRLHYWRRRWEQSSQRRLRSLQWNWGWASVVHEGTTKILSHCQTVIQRLLM